MRATNLIRETPSGGRPVWLVALAGLVLLILGSTQLLLLGHAQSNIREKSGGKTFSSAGDACHALHQAVRNNDEQGLEAILGVGREVTSSGNENADKLEREQFSQKYEQMHRLVKEPDGTTVLYIGAENWPFPIPLLSKNGRWYFDSKTGSQEILFRRVGENEATAIEVCRTLITAERPAERITSDDPIRQYARRLASADNTARAGLEKQPYSGYYFRILKGQPGNTATATYSRISSGKKRAGLAWVAYPAEYRSSGVMTFIVAQDGVVYEKDLGPNTAKLVGNIKQRPVSGWEEVK